MKAYGAVTKQEVELTLQDHQTINIKIKGQAKGQVWIQKYRKCLINRTNI